MSVAKNLLMLSLPLFLSACSSHDTEKVNDKKRTVLVQLILEPTRIDAMLETMTPLANAAIKEELGLKQDFVFDFFLTKKRHALTLYYVNDMYENGQENLFSALEKNKNQWQKLPQRVQFSTELNFFGPTNDELVIMIDDKGNELVRLREVLKKIAYKVDETYAADHEHGLFDKVKGEKFGFRPHVVIARIRSHSIKQHIKDPQQVDAVFQRIQERVKKIALGVIEKAFAKEGKQVTFEQLCGLDPQTAKILKPFSK